MSDEERRKWLEGLKEGDEVGVSRGYSSRTWKRAKVARATPKQIIVGSERFWRNSGRLVGSSTGYMVVELIRLGAAP